MTRTGLECIALLLPAGAVAQWGRRARVADGQRQLKSYCVLPSSADPRWILPLGSARLLRRAAELYRPGSFRGQAMHAAFRLAAGFGATRALPGARLHVAGSRQEAVGACSPIEAWARCHIGEASYEFALATGTPGPFRKTSVAVLFEDGTLAAQIKCATDPQAAERVRYESEVVQTIAAMDLTSIRSPSVVWSGAAAGWEAMIQRPIHRAGSPAGRSVPPVAQFQRELTAKSSQTGCLGAEPFWRSLSSRIETFGTAAALTAFRDLDRRLANRTLPLCWMHGDLASWNLIESTDSWYAVDWELAIAGAPPLLDLLHFDLYEPLLLGRATPERAVVGILAPTAQFRKLHAEFDVGGLSPADLVSIYLVDRISRLAEEQSGLRSDDRRRQIHRLELALSRVLRDR